jgi:hypothetical protein
MFYMLWNRFGRWQAANLGPYFACFACFTCFGAEFTAGSPPTWGLILHVLHVLHALEPI